VEHLIVPRKGRLTALPAKVRPASKALAGNKHSSLLVLFVSKEEKKRFITLPPGPNVIELFMGVI
jgi:hypothetical protein